MLFYYPNNRRPYFLLCWLPLYTPAREVYVEVCAARNLYPRLGFEQIWRSEGGVALEIHSPEDGATGTNIKTLFWADSTQAHARAHTPYTIPTTAQTRLCVTVCRQGTGRHRPDSEATYMS